MILKLVPQQQAAEVGVSVEDDPEEVEDLALLQLRAAPDGSERGEMDVGTAVLCAAAQDEGAVLFLTE